MICERKIVYVLQHILIGSVRATYRCTGIDICRSVKQYESVVICASYSEAVEHLEAGYGDSLSDWYPYVCADIDIFPW